ncbi:hypothetical protein OIU74_019963 [Salix koriyanagi]|uniref:Uncharacterized protein n=1 Tax=Salix koriyanagi TaxID=2511006 RepID=A0A9Q0SLN4_9ROSI|nr:hypothetical protein OIU74_019963 [Salix koriyanagi]
MGCCISKWRTKKCSIECYHDHIHVVDRLAIPPKIPKIAIPVSNKISPSPPSPTTISSCSSLSSGSSILTSKDRSFSNEFLWSCVKENPHTIRSSSSKKRSQLLASPNVYAEKLDLPPKQVVEPVKQSIPQKVNTSTTPHKRVRSNSPTTLTRQKSFRREQDRFNFFTFSTNR